MKWSKQVFVLCAIAAIISVMLTGCGGSSNGVQPPPQDPGRTGTVTGTVFAPDGTTPVAGAVVYVPANSQVTVAQQPPANAVTSTFSGPNGQFQLTDVPSGTTTIIIKKGQWANTVQANVTANQTTALPASATTLAADPQQGAPNIAVITGEFDSMEDVLAKFGMGSLDAFGHLDPGSENFAIYRGYDDMYGPAYEDAEALLTNAGKLAGYDIVFINCGADTQWAFAGATQQILQSWVQNGGILYVTDLSWPYVDEVFPGHINFIGETGVPDITTDAEVLDDGFRAWLNAQNALTAGGLVHITGFAPGWAVIDTVAAGVKVWLQGEVEMLEEMPFPLGQSAQAADCRSSCAHHHRQAAVSPQFLEELDTVIANKPLTVSFNVGQGKVLYTSYHTIADDPSTEIRPQEFVLWGLALEL